MKIGQPYQVGGATYTPADTVSYDEVGYASWYGEEQSGNATASGEYFLPDAVSAAHKTLPLPSYVEVTSLDTGRTILVRVNDRGPFAKDRLIDLSRGAAKQLGISGGGVAAVRVRRVNPPEQERATLRNGGRAAERIETPETLLTVLRRRLAEQPRPSETVIRAADRPVGSTGGAVVVQAAAPVQPPVKAPPKSRDRTPTLPAARPAAAPAPHWTAPAQRPVTPPAPSDDLFIVEQVGQARVPAPAPTPAPAKAASTLSTRSGGYFVQVGTFSTRERALSVARAIGASVAQAGTYWRVRLGPYASQAAAQDGVRKAASKGFAGARIVAND
ncbi:MAG: septal ring lytic transglycosylase RlpA family protein [Sphingobium sp.]|nr:septal ring lytic transglycosylase RlpA family protein [Sphingobium sp.]